MQFYCARCDTVYRPEPEATRKYMEFMNEVNMDNKLVFCPTYMCRQKMILVDEMMLPIIITLIKKGYRATDSCSGHIWENEDGLYNSIYIRFAPGIHIPSIPHGFYSTTKWCKDENSKDTKKFYTSIYKEYDSDFENEKPSYLDIWRVISKQVDILLEWAESLPPSVEDLKKDDPIISGLEIFKELFESGKMYGSRLSRNMNKFQSPEDREKWNNKDPDIRERLLKECGYHQGVHESVQHLWFKRKDHAETLQDGGGFGWKDMRPSDYPRINSSVPLMDIMRQILRHQEVKNEN